MLESSFCGFSGEEISLVFMEHNELHLSEFSIFITLAFLWHLFCSFQAWLGDSGVSLLSYQRVFQCSYNSISTERKWNFASGMSSHKHFSSLPPSGSSCYSKIDLKCPKLHPLFTMFWSIYIKRMPSEQHTGKPVHLSRTWDENDLTGANNDPSSDTRWLSVTCWHHLWLTRDKQVSCKLKSGILSGI